MKLSVKAGLILGACVLVSITSLSVVHTATQHRIAQEQEKWLSQSLLSLLPEGPFDNSPLHTVHWIQASALGQEGPVPVYPVYKNSQPYASVLSVTTPHGYNGNITLLLGVRFNGEIIGARVTEHQETPGLGDDIDLKRSDWITRFDGHSLATTPARGWTVKRSGGEFDAFTGATITPRAVIHAIHEALEWYKVHWQLVFNV